ncbi:hypothetical protein PSACC_00651 [Paramicrosporidium saccamoebae]|uniref:Uncharacterized protein n=1 Tax=Paramicrosporidium saccamoebae TaxID=1246581 RepID=A0A2H9TPD9_9FUNG|nr:hypothetical protein PSACC_00651 [Paramicrosporidium saccamoebae]
MRKVVFVVLVLPLIWGSVDEGGLMSPVKSYVLSAISSNADEMEYYMIELLRPRYPPFTPFDLLNNRNHKLEKLAGDQVYEYTKSALDFIINNSLDSSMAFLVSTLPLPGPINTGLLMSFQLFGAAPLRAIVKSAALRTVYPQLGAYLLRWSADFSVDMCVEVMNNFKDPFLKFKSGHLRALVVGVTQECTPPEVLLNFLQLYTKALPSDVIEELFVKMATFKRFDRFLGYFRALLDVYYAQMRKLQPEFNEAKPYKILFWNLRNLHNVFNDANKYAALPSEIKRVQRDANLSLRQNMRVVDWFLGGSKYFSTVLSGENLESAKWLCSSLLKRRNGWKELVESDAYNIAWMAQDLDMLSGAGTDFELVIRHGTPAMLATILSFNEIDNAPQLADAVGISRFPELTPMQRESTVRIKKGIVRLLPEMRRAMNELYGFPCGGFGEPKRSIVVNVDWVTNEFPHHEDVYELIYAFLEVALLIPRSVVKSVELLPKMLTFTDWINASLLQHCTKSDLRPTELRPLQLYKPNRTIINLANESDCLSLAAMMVKHLTLLWLLLWQGAFAADSSYFDRVWQAGTYVWNVVDYPATAANLVLEQVTELAVHKSRIAQARYFLGETFSDCLDSHIMNERREETWVPHVATVVDAIPGGAALTNQVADSYQKNARIPVLSMLTSWGVPSPLNDILVMMLTNEKFLSCTRYFGTALAYYVFPPGMVAALTIKVLTYNPTATKEVLVEMFQALVRHHRGSLCVAASELIDLQIPPFVLEEFVIRTRRELQKCDWPQRALKLMIEKIPMPKFMEYYELLIKYFPEYLYGQGSIIKSGIGWVFSKPTDIVLQLAEVVGIFHHADPRLSMTNFIQTLAADPNYPVNDGTYLILNYYLAHLGVIDKLQKGETGIAKFEERCRFLVDILLPTDAAIENIVKEGLYGLTALVARFPPTGSAHSKLQGIHLVSFAIKHGTELSMLAALQHAHIPATKPLHKLEPKIDNRDGASRTKNLVFNAFMTFRHTKPQIKLLCRDDLYPKVGGFSHVVNHPVNLSFLPSKLQGNEIRMLALVIANMLFEVPIHMAVEEKKAESSVLATVNKMVKRQCGHINDPYYLATVGSAQYAKREAKPLKSMKKELFTKITVIGRTIMKCWIAFCSLFLGLNAIAVFQIVSLGYTIGKNLVNMGVQVEYNLAQDQMAAGMFALGKAKTIGGMVAPIFHGHVMSAGVTLSSAIMRGIKKVRMNWERKRQLDRAKEMVTNGQTMNLLYWIKQQEQSLKEHQMDVIILLSTILEKERYEMLNLVISQLARYLKMNKSIRQLFAAQLIRSDLPVTYVRDAVGEDPSVMGPEWWAHEFMSKVVAFPRDEFQAYLKVFLNAFPTTEHNHVLELMEVPRPNKSQPTHIRQQLIFLENLVIYYILRDPERTHGLRSKFKVKRTKEALGSLEFYLDEFMAKLAYDDRSMEVRTIVRWVQDISAGQLDLILKKDYYRVMRVLRADGNAYSGQELIRGAAEQCSPKIYSILQSDRYKLNEETCRAVRFVQHSIQALGKTKVDHRCADIVITTDSIRVDNLKPQSEADVVLAASLVLERIFSVDRDDVLVANVVTSMPNATVDAVVNESLKRHCQRKRMWPQVTMENGLSRPKHRILMLGPSQADILTDRVMTGEETKASALVEVLAKYIDNDNRVDLTDQMDAGMDGNILTLDDCKHLLGYAMKRGRKPIFEILMERTVKEFLTKDADSILKLLENIRKTAPEFRKLISKYNHRTLGLL